MTAPAPSAPATHRHTDGLIAGFVSTSDRTSTGMYQDEDIPALRGQLGVAPSSLWQGAERPIPDDQATIAETLIDLVDYVGCDLVLTTGGTGPARRDVAPEATLAVATKKMPGLGEQVRQTSLHLVPTAVLSRQVAVIRETPSRATLIVSLPGQLRAVKEILEGSRDMEGRTAVPGIFAAVSYRIDLTDGPYIETCDSVIEAQRLKHTVHAKLLQV